MVSEEESVEVVEGLVTQELDLGDEEELLAVVAVLEKMLVELALVEGEEAEEEGEVEKVEEA